MFVIKKDISLKPYNTFGIDVTASYYARANTVEKILYAINFASYNKLPIFVLGGGSNILFTRDFEGVVINPAIQGVQLQSDDEQYYLFRVGAGVVWDKFVEFAAENNLGGIENLSHIPGLVGASPIQNIGAYGVEVKNTIVKVEAIEVSSRKLIEFNASECRFGYRDSIFKQEFKGKVIITHVWFRLSRNPSFVLNYGNLAEDVAKFGEVSVQNVRKAIINIRKSKLPDPAELGNAGSFFKNPIVDVDKYNTLKERHADLNGFQVSESFYKIPAGWLIEKAGWKGRQVGKCGVHHKQALILVNYGGATGNDILDLAASIQQSVKEQFGIELEQEVNVF